MSNSITTLREFKGNSVIDFPNSYVVIDIETTGLEPAYDEILEVSALKIIDNVPSDTYTSLVYCHQEIDPFITELTGITTDMLQNAPKIGEVLQTFCAFIGDFVLVGHNVNFDINFLYDAFQKHVKKPLSNDFIDTMRISRRLFPSERHHRLRDLCKRYNLSAEGSHRAETDCKTTNDVFLRLKEDVIKNYGSLDEFCTIHKKTSRTYLRASDIQATQTDFDTTHPLYGMQCVFTGTLEKMTRKDAMQLVVNVGGFCSDGVTSKTNYLILGNNDYCSTIKGGKSNKHKKAEALKLNGNDIEIISENVFYDMLDYE